MRHAPGSRVRVEVGHHPKMLTVRIANTAPQRPARPSPGSGHGLIGMRERVAMLDGDLSTRGTVDGGYEVLAHLPVSLPAPEEAGRV
jgi:signal transduction histidine kinase